MIWKQLFFKKIKMKFYIFFFLVANYKCMEKIKKQQKKTINGGIAPMMA
jgi:hypothetical protein